MNCERTAVCQWKGQFPWARPWAAAAVAAEAGEEEDASAGPRGNGVPENTNQDRRVWKWGRKVADTACKVQDTTWLSVLEKLVLPRW